MRFVVVPGFVLLTIISFISAQSNKESKKSGIPAILTTAQFVFVEPYLGPNNEGSIYDPNVSAEDRDAVTNVLEALEKWGYYKKSRALGFSWTPNCDENESEITRRCV